MPTTKEIQSLHNNVRSQQGLLPKREVKNDKIMTTVLDLDGRKVKIRVF